MGIRKRSPLYIVPHAHILLVLWFFKFQRKSFSYQTLVHSFTHTVVGVQIAVGSKKGHNLHPCWRVAVWWARPHSTLSIVNATAIYVPCRTVPGAVRHQWRGIWLSLGGQDRLLWSNSQSEIFCLRRGLALGEQSVSWGNSTAESSGPKWERGSVQTAWVEWQVMSICRKAGARPGSATLRICRLHPKSRWEAELRKGQSDHRGESRDSVPKSSADLNLWSRLCHLLSFSLST